LALLLEKLHLLDVPWAMLEPLLVEATIPPKPKKRIMRACGMHVVDSPAEIGKKVAEVLVLDQL
jgi:23S rRNA A2030 N6-methylase RlmJ